VRRLFLSLLSMALPVTFLVSIQAQSASASVPTNTSIASIANSYTDGTSVGSPGFEAGQCFTFMHAVVLRASGGSMRIGEGNDYYGSYSTVGSQLISRDDVQPGDIIQIYYAPNHTAEGHEHTAIVLSHTSGSNIFGVVDQNYYGTGKVLHHNYNPYASVARPGEQGWTVAIWRVGTNNPTSVTAANHVLRVSATGAAYFEDSRGVLHWIPDALTYYCYLAIYPLWDGLTQSQVNVLGNGQPWATCSSSGTTPPTPTTPPTLTTPTAPPTPTATTPATFSETVGGVAHTWTNYLNAGGTEGSTISSNQTVQISCRATGFAVADGDNWWYQIASSPWNNVYWVSADAFYNNGQTSGSLHGTPFFDPNVTVC